MRWPGGTGPFGAETVPGFDALGCSEEHAIGANRARVVMACSTPQAEALCGGEVFAYAPFPAGEILFFCFDAPAADGARVPMPRGWLH